jgi:hypothetical protein
MKRDKRTGRLVMPDGDIPVIRRSRETTYAGDAIFTVNGEERGIAEAEAYTRRLLKNPRNRILARYTYLGEYTGITDDLSPTTDYGQVKSTSYMVLQRQSRADTWFDSVRAENEKGYLVLEIIISKRKV